MSDQPKDLKNTEEKKEKTNESKIKCKERNENEIW